MSHNTVKWLGAVLIVFLLWQWNKLHPALIAVGVLIVLGIMLRYWGNIQGQFANLGRTNAIGGSTGGSSASSGRLGNPGGSKAI